MPSDLVPLHPSGKPVIVRKERMDGYIDKVWVATAPTASPTTVQRIIISATSNKWNNLTRQPIEISMEKLEEAGPGIRALTGTTHYENFRIHYGFGDGGPAYKKTVGGTERALTETEKREVRAFLAGLVPRLTLEPTPRFRGFFKRRAFRSLKDNLVRHFTE